MSLLKQSVAFDVSKDQLDTCFAIIDTTQKVKIKATRKFTNTPTGFKELGEWVKKHADPAVPLVYTMEATGVYHEQLAWYLVTNKQAVSVILANKARQYAASLGLKSKNDKIDSIGLARMGAEQNLLLWQPMSLLFYQLRTLTRELESLHESKTMLTNQLHALFYSPLESKTTQKRVQAMVALMEKQIVIIHKEVIALIESDATLKRKLQHITLIKGVGIMTAVTVLAETNGFALIENQKQLVSYAGYDIVENQSGKRVGKTRISKKGNSHIRRILHLPAFNVVRFEEKIFKPFFERLLQNGKKKMQAYVAVQKKLLVLIYSLWKKDEAYNGQYKIKETSSNEEPESLFPVVFEENPLATNSPNLTCTLNKVALTSRATQDELPCNESPEVLFPVNQR